jgi:hypothetical protein
MMRPRQNRSRSEPHLIPTAQLEANATKTQPVLSVALEADGAKAPRAHPRSIATAAARPLSTPAGRTGAWQLRCAPPPRSPVRRATRRPVRLAGPFGPALAYAAPGHVTPPAALLTPRRAASHLARSDPRSGPRAGCTGPRGLFSDVGGAARPVALDSDPRRQCTEWTRGVQCPRLQVSCQ